jgi:hypothetical protein
MAAVGTPGAAPSANPAPAGTPGAGIWQNLRLLWNKVTDAVAPVLHPAPAPAPAGAVATGSARRGSAGETVKLLQERLKAAGFDPGPIDGEFGPKTDAAVRAYQTAKGLTVDGVVGPQTWGALGVTYKPEAAPEMPADAGNLAKVTPAQLAELGWTNKQAFFDALRPAAEAAERQYGVPASVTLAQAALESGWGAHAIGGYNIFGIKGTGPAGSVMVQTQEFRNGRYETITDKFAKYNNFFEAVTLHGKLFHNGYYDKAVNQFAKDHDPWAFVQNIHGIYATSPVYANSLISIMRTYHLE